MNNTILRTISGTGFIAVMLAGLLINKILFAALVMFQMATKMHEYCTITMNDPYSFFTDFLRKRIRSGGKICFNSDFTYHDRDGQLIICQG